MAYRPCSMRRLALLVLGVLGLAPLHANAQIISGPGAQIPPGSGVRPPGINPRVFVVDDTSGCRFSSSIQEAVDAAGDGDVLLVKPGYYAGFVVDGKSLHVFGETPWGGTIVRLFGTIEVKNLQPDQRVVLRGLTSQASSLASSFSNNAGPVWMEGCKTDLGFTVEGTELGLFRSTVRRSQLLGGSRVFTYRSDLLGESGTSGDADCFGYCWYDSYYPDCYSLYPTPGAAGVSVSSTGRLFLFGGTVAGGRGGWGDNAGVCCVSWCSFNGARGGDALSLNSGAEAVLMDAALIPGQGGSPGGSNGQPMTGGGTSTTLFGSVGGYSVTSPIVSGSSATLTFSGPAGWNAFLTYSPVFSPVFVPERRGYSVVEPTSPTIFVGALPLSGTLQVSMPFQLPLGVQAMVLYSQAKLYDTVTGTAHLAEPSALLVMRDPCP